MRSGGCVLNPPSQRDSRHTSWSTAVEGENPST
jgi:hypothetical protein